MSSFRVVYFDQLCPPSLACILRCILNDLQDIRNLLTTLPYCSSAGRIRRGNGTAIGSVTKLSGLLNYVISFRKSIVDKQLPRKVDLLPHLGYIASILSCLVNLCLHNPGELPVRNGTGVSDYSVLRAATSNGLIIKRAVAQAIDP